MNKILKSLSLFLFTIVLSSAVFAETGTVKFTISQDWDADSSMGVPFSYAGIFIDGNSPYGGPPAEGTTDENGICELTLEEGVHTFRVAKMTSSHSYFASEEFTFTVLPGETSEFYATVAPLEAPFSVYYDCGWGNAIYITGESDYLGNWQTAYKLNYVDEYWSYHTYLPRNLEYKIVIGPWVDGDSISTDNVQWETGDNRKVNAGLYNYNTIYPIFE